MALKAFPVQRIKHILNQYEEKIKENPNDPAIVRIEGTFTVETDRDAKLDAKLLEQVTALGGSVNFEKKTEGTWNVFMEFRHEMDYDLSDDINPMKDEIND